MSRKSQKILPANEKNVEYARQIIEWLHKADYKAATALYTKALLPDPNLDKYVLAELGKNDLFFLLTYMLHRIDADHPWIYERCRDVEEEEEGVLDLWSRGHYKSTIKTFARNIQRILQDPEVTIGIFSHTGKISDAFLSQIKQELQGNTDLINIYPEVLWSNPKKDAPSWSIQNGITVKRESNPKEATVESWGLVDGQPVSKHFKVLCYDDVVTQASVYTPEQIVRTTEAWELSLSLKSLDGAICVYAGTRYNFADTYRTMLDRGTVKPRLHPATKDGTPDGEPVFLSQEAWDEIKRDQSPYVVACQHLQNPIAGSEQEFDPDWLRYYELRPENLNVFIIVDPANSKKQGSSNSAFAVIGIDHQFNKYLLDGVCHKMNLAERWTTLKNLRNKWLRQRGVQVVQVGYERYGMQADIDHHEEMMRIEGNHFPIKEVSWVREGSQSKDDRIRRLVPDFKNWRFFLPYSGEPTDNQRKAMANAQQHLIAKPIKRKNENNRVYDLVEWFVSNEYLFFPATTAKDFMDAMSRIYDMDPQPPMLFIDEHQLVPEDAELDW